MSTQTDVDDAMMSLKAAISAYVAVNGNGYNLAMWIVNQVRQSDPSIARALDSGVTRFVAEAPDRRSFATIG
ncbi:hypothetical protein [Bradyrhizobium sp. JYMT SZCCT0428]|uniref:hypothetical protein n=1 Tax=Bradyrhizobium sp. JYMT SZCCT0428 TaxID=2807673 RepID=UPI001BA5D2E6|nr:hypothetical protein [Bradyrhizobium sp. JYMT SZCCT0428]MBR1156671.1 hypothetical protein [Bradyrhizobium sp. JYMT SZCCT0428]